MEVAAFWLVVGLFIVGGYWKAHRAAELRQQMMFKLIDKGLDDELIAELMTSEQSLLKPEERKPGVAYKIMKVLGVLGLFSAPGFFIFMMLMAKAQTEDAGVLQAVALGVSLSLLLFSIGLLFASRFVEKPLNDSKRDAARILSE